MLSIVEHKHVLAQAASQLEMSLLTVGMWLLNPGINMKSSAAACVYAGQELLPTSYHNVHIAFETCLGKKENDGPAGLKLCCW